MERPSIRYDPWTARSTPYRKVPCRTHTRTSSSGRYRNDSSCGVSTTMPSMAITLKKTSTPRITALTSWPSTSMVVKCRPNRSSQTSRPVTTFEATSTCTPQQANKRRMKATSCRETTSATATPSSVST